MLSKKAASAGEQSDCPLSVCRGKGLILGEEARYDKLGAGGTLTSGGEKRASSESTLALPFGCHHWTSVSELGS